ncbi:MAG: tyrosine-type recombinase/integrase [Lachnospiraceae bacterium]|nr:tyrosine-type recombinase/integrase [Lachnospiraceae bacterium]
MERSVVSINNQYNAENDTILLSDKTTLPKKDLELLLSCGMETAKVKEMITMAKQYYVMSHHPRKIFRLPPCGSWKNGCYKTYVYVGKKRKEFTAGTEEKLIEKLYEFYQTLEDKSRSLEYVFEQLMEYKSSCLSRSDKTISCNRNLMKKVPQELREKNINDITDEEIRKFLVRDILPKRPRPAALRRLLQLLNAVFEFGIRKKMCSDNPLRYIIAQDYYKHCLPDIKTDEEKAFSEEELAKLSADAENHLDNPRVLMSLLAMETGMRVGELTALHIEDVLPDYIHVHRQQITVGTENGNEIVEVPYTKDERMHPHNGRFVPLTAKARQVISWAMAIPGRSPYLFHESYCDKMIPKDGYTQNLRTRCRRLGCIPTNNHAFRMAFNSRLIELGFSSADRALILGHEVQTNEAHYSLTDKRRLENIKNRIN